MKPRVADLPQLGMQMGLGRTDFLAQVKHGPGQVLGQHQSKVVLGKMIEAICYDAAIVHLAKLSYRERGADIPVNKSRNG